MRTRLFRPLEIAEAIIKTRHVLRMTLGSKPQLLIYQAASGLYVLGDLEVEREAQQRCRRELDSVKNQDVREVVTAVRRNAILVRPNQLNDPARRIVTFKNGVLDLRNPGSLLSHSPDNRYTLGIPHQYNRDAQCPVFEQFMSQVLPPETHKLVRQLLGYLLIPSAAYRVFFVFLGDGANGKSTLIKVVETLLGCANVSHESMHSLTESRFSPFELFGKLANTFADLDDADVKKLGMLKQIAAGDTIRYEQKFQDPFSGPVTARLVFSANTLPRMPDDSDAIADRLMLLRFPNRFDGDNADKHLIDKLTTNEEREGILATWAVPGLLDLLETGCFTRPRASVELLDECLREADSVLDFARQWVKQEKGQYVTRTRLYAEYRCFCREEEIEPIGLRDFNRRIRQIFKIPSTQDFRAPETRERIWPDLHFAGDPRKTRDASRPESQE